MKYLADWNDAMDAIFETDRLVTCVADRLRDHRERIAALEIQSLDASDEREQAAIAERDLKRLERYRAVLRCANPALMRSTTN
jgi:uncharacterized membrane protein YccC